MRLVPRRRALPNVTTRLIRRWWLGAKWKCRHTVRLNKGRPSHHYYKIIGWIRLTVMHCDTPLQCIAPVYHVPLCLEYDSNVMKSVLIFHCHDSEASLHRVIVPSWCQISPLKLWFMHWSDGHAMEKFHPCDHFFNWGDPLPCTKETWHMLK